MEYRSRKLLQMALIKLKYFTPFPPPSPNGALNGGGSSPSEADGRINRQILSHQYVYLGVIGCARLRILFLWDIARLDGVYKAKEHINSVGEEREASEKDSLQLSKEIDDARVFFVLKSTTFQQRCLPSEMSVQQLTGHSEAVSNNPYLRTDAVWLLINGCLIIFDTARQLDVFSTPFKSAPELDSLRTNNCLFSLNIGEDS
ncbi:hypothetical protein CDAR_70901 [Caerostris darwini]|uniref:Uncharacterized protein n=1 Tax=Caerostris darwini TaxID=1538125 RepID=A0AAV4WGJ2_9ARAC|nr:hypothetical protein CDAR_70901 [Caerostris darwini]